MSDTSKYYEHVQRKPGAKIAKRVRAGTLTMNHPGGVVSMAFREKAQRRNLERKSSG